MKKNKRGRSTTRKTCKGMKKTVPGEQESSKRTLSAGKRRARFYDQPIEGKNRGYPRRDREDDMVNGNNK